MGKNLKLKATRQTIVAIEKGDYNPTVKLCILICQTLGKTLDELFWPGPPNQKEGTS